MTPTGTLTNIAPGKGGIERRPYTLASHALQGGTLEMLRRCIVLNVHTSRQADNLVVTVTTQAHSVGHRVPTGFIDRHLILVIENDEGADKPPVVRNGPVLPLRAGPKLAGRPGWIFGKQNLDAGDRPSPFWKSERDLIDTRLIPDADDVRRFVLAGPTSALHVRLIYRRFWHDVAAARGWTDNDLLVWEKKLD